MRRSLPVIQDAQGQPLAEPATKKPEWLKIRPPGGEHYTAMKHRARRLKLATVCEEARCPNLSECWGGGTATFMLMGEICTRGCRFCAVDTKKLPPPLDPDEPRAIAEAVEEMGLSYVVLTSVNRDELPDGGASHLADCLNAIHQRTPSVLMEMLSPDFEGNMRSVELVASTPLAVFAHNVETVERLTPSVRDPRASYAQSLEVLEHAKRFVPHVLTKSSLMVGLGESEAEIEACLRDLRDVDCDIVTFGQYLQPTPKHLPVVEYAHPNTFERYAELARGLGFGYVASGPLVRSSYRAGELFVERHLRARAQV
ncbi:MAG: lipoyl synthase [Deltaproteobacteria bacterium]|nr:lipoyl synthase [Deltaproteobacteria bacterium]